MAEGGREGNMQVGDGEISNTVEVRGFSKKTSQEVMEMYFENSRRSGGGDLEEVMIRDEVAYITFKEAEVAQRVALRSNHQVDGHTLTVTLFHPLPPKPCYQNRVLIQGLNNAITEELLRNFLESKTKAQFTEFLYGEEDGNVVVTLSDNIDIVQLGKLFQESSIDGVFLKVERVAISNCILVQNLQPSSSHDAILLYFENKRRSGGGDVEKVEMKTEERYCLIYFEDPSVIDRVLGQSHNVDGVDFEIHLHHECLGRRSSRKRSVLYLRMCSLGSKDRATLEDENTDNQVKEKTSSSISSNPEKESDFVEVQEWQENDGKNCTLPLWIKYKRTPDMKMIRCMKNIPCSWNFHLYWNFYTKTEPGKQMLHEILNKYSCSVAVFAEDEYLFLFEITEQIFEQQSDVVQLIHVVLDNVYKCAQQVLYLDNILVDQRIQGDVLQVVRQRKELDIARFELMGEQDVDAICVICTEKDHSLVLCGVTEIIHKFKECFENHEETIQVDHKWQKVMTTFGYLQKLCDKFPNVTIISDKNEAAIMLKGPRDQSKPAADYFMELLGTASSEVQEEIFSPGCQFEIFTYPDMCGYIDNITMELSIVWIPNHQTKKIHLFSKRSEKIKGVDKFIKGCVKERLYPLAKDQTVFSTKVIRCLEELKKRYTGKVMFTPSPKGLLLTTTDDIFESIDDTVQEIICKETVPMGSEGVQPTKNESHLSSEQRVDSSLRESSARDKENDNVYKSPRIQKLICMQNGVYLVKIDGGKMYALPFSIATKPQIIYSEGFYCIMHDNVWYQFQQYSLESLHLQNIQTKNCIKLTEYSESVHVTIKKTQHTDIRHSSQESLDSQTIAESTSMSMEAITNSSVEMAQRAEGEIVTETDKLAAKRTEINRGETCETNNEEKPIDETSEKSRIDATVSSGGNAVKGFEAEIDTNIDQTQTGDPVQKCKGELSRGYTGNISGDTDKTTEDVSQASRNTGKKHKKETLVETFCDIDGIDRVEHFGGTAGMSEGNVSNISSSPAAAPEMISGNEPVLKLVIKLRKKHGKKYKNHFFKHTVSCNMHFRQIWNFYTQTGHGKQMLDAITGKHHCKVSLSVDDYLKECFIFDVSDANVHNRSDVKNFVDEVLHDIEICAEESLFIDKIGIDLKIQDKVRKRIKDRQELNGVWVEFVGDDNPVTVYTVCSKDQHQFVMENIIEVITDATKSLTSHTDMVAIDFMWQTVMTRFEYLKEIGVKFPSTEIIQDKNNNAFMLKGPHDEVKAAAGHLEELLKMAHKEVHEKVFSPGYQFEIFTSEMCDYIDKSLPKLPVIWIPNHQTKKIHLFSRDYELFMGIDKSIKSCIVERLYPLSKQHPDLSSDQRKLLKELMKKHEGKIVIYLLQSPTGLLLTAADDIFQDVDAAVQTIIGSEIDEAHLETLVSEKLDGKPGSKSLISNPGTELKDLSSEQVSDVQKVTRCLVVKDENIFRKLIINHMEKINQKAKEHCVSIKKCQTQSKVGFELKGIEKDVKIIYDTIRLQEHQFQQDIIAGATGKIHKQMLPISDAAGKSGAGEMSEPFFNKIKVSIQKGELHNAKAEVFINTISPDLDLSKGVISASLLKKAGQSIQREIKTKEHPPVPYGSVIKTSSCQLPSPCKVVLHVVLQLYHPSDDSTVTFNKLLEKCLDQASRYQSVAFPAIGTGKLGYPKDMVASLMLTAVINFERTHPNTSLKEVKFVIYPNDKETYQVFQDTILKFKTADKEKRESSNFEIHVTGLKDKDHKANSGNVAKGDVDDSCIHCMCPKEDPKALSCGHSFCSGCIDQMLEHKPVCPVCGKIVGTLTGDQPKNGRMDVRRMKFDLAGYEGHGSIVITYDFPAGRQESNHPSPGAWYTRMMRSAYLPNTAEGRTVCRMLQLAFKRRLVFTISQSRTTGTEGLTWNDIHHKTNSKPGGQFGYPDPVYLSRVKEELAAKGITEADLPPE